MVNELLVCCFWQMGWSFDDAVRMPIIFGFFEAVFLKISVSASNTEYRVGDRE